MHRALSYPDEAHEGSGKEIEVEIKSGMSFPAVAVAARRARRDRAADVVSPLRDVGRRHDEHQAGQVPHQGQPDAEARCSTIIVTGVKELTVKVTLPEGKNMLEYFELIGKRVPPA